MQQSTVVDGAEKFITSEWIPLVLEPITWIALVTSWATVETIKQISFIYKQHPAIRRDINRILGFATGFVYAFMGYHHYVPEMDIPIIPAMAVGILSPWVYRITVAVLEKFEFTREIVNTMKPHQRNKFVPVPKENEDDPTLFMKEKDE